MNVGGNPSLAWLRQFKVALIRENDTMKTMPAVVACLRFPVLIATFS